MHEDGLFREEALRRFREGGTRGQVLRLGARWTTAAFVLLLAGVAAGTVCLFLVTVPVAVHGPAAVVEGDRVLALLPAARRDDVAREGYLTWRQADGDAVLQVDRIEPRVVERDEARTLVGGVFAGRALPETSLLVWAIPAPGLWIRDDGTWDREIALQGTGTVSLQEHRVRLIDLFRSGER